MWVQEPKAGRAWKLARAQRRWVREQSCAVSSSRRVRGQQVELETLGVKLQTRESSHFFTHIIKLSNTHRTLLHRSSREIKRKVRKKSTIDYQKPRSALSPKHQRLLEETLLRACC